MPTTLPLYQYPQSGESAAVQLLSQWATRYPCASARSFDYLLIGNSHVKRMSIIATDDEQGSAWYKRVRSHLMNEQAVHVVAQAFTFPNERIRAANEKALFNACGKDRAGWLNTLEQAMRHAATRQQFLLPMTAYIGFSSTRHVFDEIYREFDKPPHRDERDYYDQLRKGIQAFSDYALRRLREDKPLDAIVARALEQHCPETMRGYLQDLQKSVVEQQEKPPTGFWQTHIGNSPSDKRQR